MLASDVDAVIIATPVFLHAEHFEAAVKAGKHIYIEKPASMDVEGCKRIMRAADGADRKLNITFGFQRRYGQVYQKAKQLADSGAIGPIHMGFARFIKSGGSMEGIGQASSAEDGEGEDHWLAWVERSVGRSDRRKQRALDRRPELVPGRPAVERDWLGRVDNAETGRHARSQLCRVRISERRSGPVVGMLLLRPTDTVTSSSSFSVRRGMIETSENHWRHFRGPQQETTEKSPRNITIDSVAAFVQRIQDGKPENTGVRGAESTLTAILGRMAMDRPP